MAKIYKAIIILEYNVKFIWASIAKDWSDSSKYYLLDHLM